MSSCVNLAPKWIARVRQLVLRSPSLGRKIVVSFTTKYAVPRQIKPRIPKLSIRRRQSNLINALILAMKNCYRFGRIAQFYCRSYCKHSHRKRQANHFFAFISIFELGGITFASRKQNSLFPLGPVITKCLMLVQGGSSGNLVLFTALL